MVDLKLFESNLKADNDLRIRFLNHPSETMEEAGIKLNEEMKKNLEKAVADFKATNKLPSGSSLASTADTNVGVGIGIRVGGGM